MANYKLSDVTAPEQTAAKSYQLSDVSPLLPTSYEEGRNMPTLGKSLLNVAQGPTFGFADELAGVGGALISKIKGKDAVKGYESTRDYVRGGVDQLREEYPLSSILGTVAGAIPTAAALPVRAMTAAGGVGIGAGYGALQGAGDAKTAEETPQAAGKGFFFGAGTSAVPAVIGTAGTMAAGAINKPSALYVARSMLAKKFEQAGRTPQEISRMLDEMPEDAVIAQVAGEPAMNTLRTVAQQQGRTPQAAKEYIEELQAGRGYRMRSAAGEGLSPSGARLPETLTALREKQLSVAGPIYQQLQTAQVPPTPEVQALLNRASLAFSDAKKIAGVEGKQFVAPELAANGQPIPLTQIDTIKRSLYDMEEATRDPLTGRLNEAGNAIKNLRRDLVATVDTLIPAYKTARDAFAGPAAVQNAANLGNKSINSPDWKIRDITDGMGASELEGFRVGAFEALRQKLGTQAGQTEAMNMWRNPSARERIKEIFGDFKAFDAYAKQIGIERQMREIERVRGGSQTAQTLMDESDNAALAEGAKAAVSGGMNLRGAIGTLANMRTPEKVRDELGRILLSRKFERAPALGIGPSNQGVTQAEYELGAISRQIERARKMKAGSGAGAGTLGGLLSGR
jgi:hypothetical protein